MHLGTSSTKGMLPLISLIGTHYKMEENHSGYAAVAELFNTAMQSHLEASE